MVEPIISQLGKKGLLEIHHLQLLLNNRTSVLDLTYIKKGLNMRLQYYPEEKLDMLVADPIDVRLNQRLLHGLITQCQVSTLFQYLSMQGVLASL